MGGRRVERHPAAGDPHRRGRGGTGLRGCQAALPAAGCHPPGGHGIFPRGAPEPVRGRAPAVADQAPWLGSDGGHRLGGARVRRPGGGVRLPAGQRHHPPGRQSAELRERGGARPGVARPPGAPVPRAAVGGPQRAEAGEHRPGPDQARPEPGQGHPVASGGAADDFRACAASPARGPEDAGRPAGHDGARAGSTHQPDRGPGEPVGDRLHAGQLPDLAAGRRSWCS